MEISTMGKVLVTAHIQNLQDIYMADGGMLPPTEIRSVEVTDALVDTGATMLSLPGRLIEQLGLRKFRVRRVQTTMGVTDSAVYGAVRLTIQDRECTMDVAEISDSCPVLIGQLPLEALDFVVDPIGQRLIGNPAHGGEHMIEMY